MNQAKKKKLKNNNIISAERKQSADKYETRWPKAIGRGNKPNDDGKIRAADGAVLG